MNCLLVDWEQVRIDCKYPKSDNNEGYIFGIYICDEDEIIDVEWFKTDEERFKEIDKYNLVVIND